jgi:omega-amidase
MQYLNIALIQSSLFWQDIEKNRTLFSKKIESLPAHVDVIILPEMFTTGFTMTPKLCYETMDGDTVKWMKKYAKTKKAAICGSAIIQEHNNFYNRFLFVAPNGSVSYYDKRHTFTLAGEHKVYSRGQEKVIIDYFDWKICPMICYDLRFPVWSRNTENYEVLIYVANWPTPRINAWDTLLKARAIENMSYCVGVNRVGEDANQHNYPGHSIVYNALGESLCAITENDSVSIVKLQKTHLRNCRKKFKFLNDRDSFNLVK